MSGDIIGWWIAYLLAALMIVGGFWLFDHADEVARWILGP